MFKQKKIAVAVRFASLGLGASLLTCLPALAQDSEVPNETSKQEEMLITGSHIKRSSDFENGGQVVGIDAVKIEALGSLNIADVLRASPLNSYGSFSERSGSSAQSNASINLRGLGDQRTLVLVDGRRMVGSPNMGAAVTNINMIPMAAIERVDIQADGSSAIYGTDAVAGVVNMMTKRGINGFELTARYGDRSEDDGSERAISLVGGFDTDRGNITFAVEKSKRDPVWDKDRDYTAPWARDENGNGVIDAYVETDGYSYYGKAVELWDPNTEYYGLKAATSCAAGDGFYGEASADMAFGLTDSTVCLYGYADISANKASLDKTNAYVNATYKLNDKAEFYVSSLVSRVESFGRYAPPAAGWPDMPADYADVPFDIDTLLESGEITEDYELYGYYRWTNIGPRDNNVTDTLIDFSAGLQGDLTDNISYDVYVQNSSYDVKEYGYYYLSYPGLDYVLNEGIDPFTVEGAGAMSATSTQDNFSKMSKVYGHMQVGLGDLFGAGDVIGLVGAESMEFSYQNKYDRASEAGLVGGSSGNSSDGDRDVVAIFGELLAPVADRVELNASIRYDSYSDFGENVSPTISATWGVTDEVTLRARYGQGFRAPGLDELYGPERFSAEDASDQYTCALSDISPEECPSRQFDTYYYTSPDLSPETSESLSFGINWRPLDNLTLDVGYWDINIQDIITQPLPQELFDAELAGVVLVARTYVDRTGGLPVIHSTYTNSGDLGATGLDFQIDGYIDTRFGTVTSDLLVAYSLSFDESAYFTGGNQNTAGYNLQPKVKGQWGIGWSLASNRVDLIVEYIGPSAEQDFVVRTGSKSVLEKSDEDLDSLTTLNLSYSYDLDTFGEVKIGARNLTNEDPVLDRDGKFDGSHYELYDSTGRVLFAEYKIKF
ncbi:TonB-dependent receptor plug domain-containing protein [Teredinibacter haidensis]|uniref:TonB-dependent receptor plug domain-containing protein n=1 Tax=Teredinibacter haidensis TaxID=2731755 RepID=UPI000948FE13|nr:TonB-dependent receptor [Teredinibacter haidensis]